MLAGEILRPGGRRGGQHSQQCPALHAGYRIAGVVARASRPACVVLFRAGLEARATGVSGFAPNHLVRSTFVARASRPACVVLLRAGLEARATGMSGFAPNHLVRSTFVATGLQACVWVLLRAGLEARATGVSGFCP